MAHVSVRVLQHIYARQAQQRPYQLVLGHRRHPSHGVCCRHYTLVHDGLYDVSLARSLNTCDCCDDQSGCCAAESSRSTVGKALQQKMEAIQIIKCVSKTITSQTFSSSLHSSQGASPAWQSQCAAVPARSAHAASP